MEIIITDEEKEAVKARVLATVEQRLTQEAMTSMQRSVAHDVAKRLHQRATELLEEAMKKWLTDEKVSSYLAKAMEELTVKQYGGDSRLEKEVKNVVYRVTQAHADAVSKELQNLLYVVLRDGFFKKVETSSTEENNGT